VTQKPPAPCKRPYSLGRRKEISDRKHERILATARAELESNGFLHFTLDTLARQSGVTRQTIHNLFGTKASLLAALFDQLAIAGGMEGMRTVMQQTNPESMLDSFVKLFSGFWAKDRLLIRRIHGIAAIDPEFEAALETRNQRRRGAATRVIDLLDRRSIGSAMRERQHRIASLYALTSFEFFNALAESCDDANDAADIVLRLVRKAFSGAPRE
jgi:AcrR family transcriptional regulator